MGTIRMGWMSKLQAILWSRKKPSLGMRRVGRVCYHMDSKTEKLKHLRIWEEAIKKGVDAAAKRTPTPQNKAGNLFYFIFFEGNYRSSLYWKLHPWAVFCVKEAFMDLPRDLSRSFKRNIYGKMHPEFSTTDL